jgi:ribosomal protein L35AE/L33A
MSEITGILTEALIKLKARVDEIVVPEAINGEKGEQGEKGEKGDNGLDGKDGQDGKDGIDGEDGINGIDGKNGLNGIDGIDGKDGADGQDGADGRDGVDGKDGKDGRAGYDGLSIKGDKGDIPKHEWQGTKLKFELPDGNWGKAVDLAGKDGIGRFLGGSTGVQRLTSTGNTVQITNDGTTFNLETTGGGGGITSVTGTSPIASSGGSTPAISISQSNTTTDGYLSATDWNTFNNKAPATSGTSLLYGNNAGGFSNVTIGSNLTFSGGTLSASGGSGITEITSLDGSLVVTQEGTVANVQVSEASPASTILAAVRNVTGATLTKGTVVYINGAAGNKATVTKAIATSDATSAQTLGLITADLPTNTNGYATIIGQLVGLNTSAFTEGDQLYLSGTVAGTYTATKTLAPTHLVYVGVVTRSHVNQGAIEVKIQNGYELNELHDVSIVSKANNEVVVYESATNLWKNKTIETILGYTPYSAANPSGYISSYTETDPVFVAHVAYGITSTKITNWDTAYSWGNHASAGYLTSAAIGSTVQAYDADLTSWAAIAPSAKQDALVSGTSIKTVNSTSLLGSGDIVTGDVTLTGAQTLTNKTITGFKETRAASSANNFNLDSANYFTHTVSGATTFTVSNTASSGSVSSFIIDLTNGGSAAITWWANMKWVAGTAPTLTSSGRDVLGFFTHNGGTTWTGLVIGKDVK